jgi:TRAP-type uncharacterized transport system substrate-binding protein
MSDVDPMTLSWRERMHVGWIALALVAAGLWGVWQFLQSSTPRHIVVASGVADGMPHELAQRYREILAREGVTVEERMTAGGAENARLLHDPASGVDVAFMPAGVATAEERSKLVMIASLYYEPVWIFYRGDAVLTRIEELRHKRIAIGAPGHGTRALCEPLLAANGITALDAELLPLGNIAALRALQSGELDAIFLSGPAKSPAVWQALYDSTLKLMDLPRADAYPRRFPHITRLTLPPGTIDLAQLIPAQEVRMIATKAMLVARDDLPAPLVRLLYDAAAELHSGQGFFEASREFPNATPLDLPVSDVAYSHQRFGPGFLRRYLPFWAATLIERLIVVMLPLIVVVVPLVNLLPQLMRWRVRSRIYRWYGELALLERDVAARTGVLPIERWLADLDRIQRSVEKLRTPTRFASETYTLREHIGLVRRAVLVKAGEGTTSP